MSDLKLVDVWHIYFDMVLLTKVLKYLTTVRKTNNSVYSNNL